MKALHNVPKKSFEYYWEAFFLLFIFTSPGRIQLFYAEAATVSLPARAPAAHRTEAWRQTRLAKGKAGWSSSICQANRRPSALGISPAKQAPSSPCCQNHLKEPQKGHKRSNNPQMASEWTASQESSLSQGLQGWEGHMCLSPE